MDDIKILEGLGIDADKLKDLHALVGTPTKDIVNEALKVYLEVLKENEIDEWLEKIN
jgi:hypothetical protein